MHKKPQSCVVWDHLLSPSENALNQIDGLSGSGAFNTDDSAAWQDDMRGASIIYREGVSTRLRRHTVSALNRKTHGTMPIAQSMWIHACNGDAL